MGIISEMLVHKDITVTILLGMAQISLFEFQ